MDDDTVPVEELHEQFDFIDSRAVTFDNHGGYERFSTGKQESEEFTMTEGGKALIFQIDADTMVVRFV